jgi:hypothetical protein
VIVKNGKVEERTRHDEETHWVAAHLSSCHGCRAGLKRSGCICPDGVYYHNNPPKETTHCVETVVTSETETTNTTQPCEVGNSGRQGAQAGTLTETFRVTTTTTTTTVYRGEDIIFGPSTTPPVVERELLSSEFSPTGPCRNIPGPQ